jgi:DTW domain-containing protein YfiP
MHPKEFRRTKNGTGHFTNLSLSNCEIHMGVDFSKNRVINEIIDNPKNACYVLYPALNSINLNKQNIKKNHKNSVIFLIDSTWPCSRKILASSPNIDNLQKVSFTHSKISAFKFKEQPQEYCLSTMESTLCVLELLNESGTESIDSKKLANFLLPFEKMVEYQLSKC